ncbi:hypothetical protein SDC9_54289 [bioreactor metagenome]|uniref:Uncharacterized protein n=1 Tax=bioreactor metagenome TaxID=1076179 RepID=A0A644WWW9_9ZZZZ
MEHIDGEGIEVAQLKALLPDSRFIDCERKIPTDIKLCAVSAEVVVIPVVHPVFLGSISIGEKRFTINIVQRELAQRSAHHRVPEPGSQIKLDIYGIETAGIG